jgi:FkbM family methyltransferase
MLWTLYPYSAYWRLGGHEPEMVVALQMAGDLRGKAIWDLGAHFGIYTLSFSRLAGNAGQVVALEPDAASFARLSLHVRMNRLSNVSMFNAAASETSGESFIVLSSGPGGTTSHLLYEGEFLSESSIVQRINQVRADDLVADGKIRCPDFVKLDVEGHGGNAVAGAVESIGRSRPLIVASMHSPQEIEGIRATLEPLGYGAEKLGNKRTGPCGWQDCECGANYLLRPAC